MRKLLLTALLLAATVVDTGCIVPIWSSSRDIRARELIFTSEGLRHIPEIWERMGVDLNAVIPVLLQAAAKTGDKMYRGFQKNFFSKLVPNVRKLGLLDANDGYLRQLWGEAGLLEFEFADDTGSDYESYDAVAADRAAAAAGS